MNETPLERRRRQHLELLVRDYEQARDDERHALGIQINILGMAIAALAAMIAAAFAIGVEGEAMGSGYVLIGFYGVMPALLLLPALAALWFARHAVIRGFYMRALERKIREQAGFSGSPGTGATPYRALRV
ncbi:hypothetical protein [Actinomyces qiguomingii]|uniref:hypothetical protein n=1 Tax=Actinomyces qiguomingii TaxID=2057800 RepID=UPI000CA072B2|nr:hypothetical protein [Actinomyces qiguomingii]